MQKLRDDRASKAQLAALIEELIAQGKAIVEDAGHYAEADTIYVSALNRADGEPASQSESGSTRRPRRRSPDHSQTAKILNSQIGKKIPSPCTSQQGSVTTDSLSHLAKCREATKVRREFVKTLLSRKAAPKGWQYFTVHAITHYPETVSGYDGKVAADMIGAKTTQDQKWGWNPLRDHTAATTGPARLLPGRPGLRRV